MKALTIKQPYASWIVNGYKEYEFRSWKTNYQGKILIHAGLSKEKDKMKDYDLDYPLGCIIGEATIIDCIQVNEDLDNKLRQINPIIYGNNHIGMYAWKLGNVIKYDKPIYIKGKLGLWNYEK